MNKNQISRILVKGSLAAALATALVACGGGGSSSSSSSSTLTASFPTGVTSSSPTSITDGSSVTARVSPGIFDRFNRAFSLMASAIGAGDWSKAAQAFLGILPIEQAWAAPARKPEAAVVAEYLESVATGLATPTATNLPLAAFFQNYTAANCYGPEIIYDNHDQGDRVGSEVPTSVNPNPAPNTGPLPTGDVGMWLAREGDQVTGTPCSVAQLDRLIEPLKKRSNSSLMLAARLRAIAIAGSGLPASGATATITTNVNTFFQTLLPVGATGTVSLASIENGGASYTYSFVATMRNGENNSEIAIKIVHSPGSSGAFSGVLTYATAQSTDNCAGGRRANVGTVRYDRTSATEMNVTSREAPVCVPTATAINTTFSNFATLTTDGELDPITTDGSNGGPANTKGWSQQGSGFKRFGATFNPSTQAGNYKFAWQAGVGDSHSRMFAMNINASGDDRTGKAFFGFSGNMAQTAATSHNLHGMICNWAGPGNLARSASNPTQNVTAKFQYQSVTLPGTATRWDIAAGAASSKLAFAPTNTCDSGVGMTYDVNASRTLSVAEGTGVANDLDAPVAPRTTVQAEIESRGFTNPTRF